MTIDERHYQWVALGAGGVNASKRGFQDHPVLNTGWPDVFEQIGGNPHNHLLVIC